VIEDKVYLLAKDVRKALGCKSIEQLQVEYPEIVKHIKDLPALVFESDFNTILTSDKDAMEKLKHIEITRVETLRNNTEAIKSIYPLKFMVAGKMFESEARMAGYQSVNEYIEEVDYVKDVGVNLMSCNAPGISFYISQAEVIKLLNPNMYRDIVLIDGDSEFVHSKTITKDAFKE
jgi:hypothetical protein